MPKRLLSSDHDFIDSIAEDDLPALIACLWSDKGYKENMNKLESVSRYFHGSMHIYYAMEDMFPYFRSKYGIPGTPTYLILYKGDVLGTILGKVSIQSLIDHLTINFLTHVNGFKLQQNPLQEKQTAEPKDHDGRKKKPWTPDK